jgi:cell division protein FtsB
MLTISKMEVVIFFQYVTLFRNLHYLQHQLAQAERAEREQAQNAEQSMRVAVQKMRMEMDQSAPAYEKKSREEYGYIKLSVAGIKMDMEDGDENGENDDPTESKGFPFF